MLGLIQGGLSIASGLKGLFGSKKTPQPDIRKNMIEQAQGARLAAAQQGFNPLTMLQYGQPGGAGFASGGGGTPVLASVDAITSGLQGIDDVISGDAARRRQADQLEIDMAKLKLDQMRHGVVTVASVPRTAADSVGSGPAPMGRQTARVAQSNSRDATPNGFGPKPAWATGRTLDVAPVTNSPGVFEMQNPVTGGKPITIPGEGEPWGIDELATAVVVGGPQIAYNAIQDARAENARMSDLRENNPAEYERERFERQQRANKRAPKDANSRSWNQTFQIPGVSN